MHNAPPSLSMLKILNPARKKVLQPSLSTLNILQLIPAARAELGAATLVYITYTTGKQAARAGTQTSAGSEDTCH